MPEQVPLRGPNHGACGDACWDPAAVGAGERRDGRAGVGPVLTVGPDACGVVAMIELPIYRNAAYNVLDIVSKNVVGIVVSVVALTYDPAAAAA